MPSTYEALRRKFMTPEDDGIEKCESILLAAGFIKLSHGTFKAPYPNYDLESYTLGDINDAMDYLVGEWDYCVK